MGSSGWNLRPLVIQSIIQHLVSRIVPLYVRTSGLKGKEYKHQPNPITELKTYYSQERKRALSTEDTYVKVYSTKSATKRVRLQNTGNDKRSFSGQQLVSILYWSHHWNKQTSKIQSDKLCNINIDLIHNIKREILKTCFSMSHEHEPPTPTMNLLLVTLQE